MHKAIVLAFSVAGAAGITTGGYYLVKNKRSETTSQNSTDKVTSVEDSLQEFKNDKDGECIKSIFSPENINFDDAPSSSNLPSDNYSFANSDATNANGCLLIKWEKKSNSGENAQWSGTFTWIWTFVSDNKGFINFNVATTSADKKLSVKGGFYLLEKEESIWKVKHKKEITTGKDIDKTTFENDFPKSNLDGVETPHQNYWGFLEDKDSLDKICSTDSCPDGVKSADPTIKKFKWTLDKTGSKKAGEWSSDLKWWEKMYEDSTNKFDLKTKLDSFSGTWSTTS